MSDEEVQRSLGNIEGKLDALVDTVGKHVSADEKKFADLYNKSNGHDQFRSRVKGVSKGVTGVVAVVGTVATMVAKAKGMF